MIEAKTIEAPMVRVLKAEIPSIGRVIKPTIKLDNVGISTITTT
jgi:hypothetical protein